MASASKRRIDAPETIEDAMHFLNFSQKTGWSLDEMKVKIEHHRIHGKGPKMPVRKILTIELVPFQR